MQARVLLVVVLGFSAVGCDGDAFNECKIDDDCDLASGGRCFTYEASGNRWCAYPDPSCPNDMRWSDVATGDGLAGACVGPTAPDAGGADADVADASIIDGSPDGASPDAEGDGGVIASDWAKRFGAAGFDGAQDVALDVDGSVHVVGTFSGTVDFGAGDISSAGGTDIFVAKFGQAGMHEWSVSFGGSGADSGLAISVADNGDVFVGGSFSGTVDFGDGAIQSAGGTDGFVLKLSGASGALVWGVRMGGSSSDKVVAVAVDAAGAVATTGSFVGTVNFGGGNVISNGGQDVFVAKYAGANGTHQWSRAVGGASTDDPGGIAIGGGDVIIAGRFYGSGEFGGDAITAAGGWDTFIARYGAADGGHVWSFGHGSSGADQAYDVVTDASSVFITGNFLDTANLGGGDLVSAGSYDGYVAKYDLGTGSHLWSVRFGGTSSDAGRTVGLDGASVVIGGTFSGTATIAGLNLSSAGNADAFVAQFSASNGTANTAAGFGGPESDSVQAVVFGAGAGYLAGLFRGSVDFFGVNLTSSGDADAFLIRHEF